MFVLNIDDNKPRHFFYSPTTLRDFLVCLNGDRPEAQRIATIAGNMKIGDAFSNKDIYLKCKDEEEQ